MRAGLGARSFGFHGMFNWPYVLTDAQIAARVVRATGYVLGSQHCREMQAVLAARRGGTGGSGLSNPLHEMPTQQNTGPVERPRAHHLERVP